MTTEYIPDSILKLQKLNLQVEEQLSQGKEVKVEKLDDTTLSNILQVVLIPEIVIELITALDHNVIDPNFLLTKSISNIKDERNLIAIALALRYNANPNLYVRIPDFGVVHILIYTYIKLNSIVSPELLNTIFLLLIQSKSNPMLPAIDQEAGGVKSIFEVQNDISVLTWITERSITVTETNIYTTTSNTKTISNVSLLDILHNRNVPQNELDKIGIYLDKPDMIKSPVDVTSIISFHANNVLEEKKNKITQPEYVLSETVTYLNLEAFRKVLVLNSNVSYFFVNDLLIRMKIYHKNNMVLPFNITKTMLLMLIERGIKLDTYQLDIIKSTGEKNTKEIIDIYQRPYWSKIMNYTGPGINGNNYPNLANNEIRNGNQKLSEVPFDLRILAYALGLNYNADMKLLLEQIRKISFTDPVAYKNAFIRRQMSRISTNASTPLDFINEPHLEKYTARNIPLLKKDNKNPYEYNELDIGVFKDSNEVVWIFTSDMFEQIVETKRNPYTNEILPVEFLSGLQLQRSLIKRLGFDVKRSLTVNDGLERMNKQDVINNEENERIINQFEQLCLIHNVDVMKVRNLTYEQKMEILTLHKIRINNLYEFSPAHQYVIFCRGCLLYLQSLSSEPHFSSKLEEFFDSIRNI